MPERLRLRDDKVVDSSQFTGSGLLCEYGRAGDPKPRGTCIKRHIGVRSRRCLADVSTPPGTVREAERFLHDPFTVVPHPWAGERQAGISRRGPAAPAARRLVGLRRSPAPRPGLVRAGLVACGPRAGGDHGPGHHGGNVRAADRRRGRGDLRREPHRAGRDLSGAHHGAAGEPHPFCRARGRAGRAAALAPAAGPVADQPARAARDPADRRLRPGRPDRPVAPGGHAHPVLSGHPVRHGRPGPDVHGRRDLDPGHPPAGAAGGLVDGAPLPLPGPGVLLRARHRARAVVRRPSAHPGRVVRGVGGHGRAGAGLPGRPAGLPHPAPPAPGRRGAARSAPGWCRSSARAGTWTSCRCRAGSSCSGAS